MNVCFQILKVTLIWLNLAGGILQLNDVQGFAFSLQLCVCVSERERKRERENKDEREKVYQRQ